MGSGTLRKYAKSINNMRTRLTFKEVLLFENIGCKALVFNCFDMFSLECII